MSGIRFDDHLGSVIDRDGHPLVCLADGERRVMTHPRAWWQEVYDALHAQWWIEKPADLDKQPVDEDMPRIMPLHLDRPPQRITLELIVGDAVKRAVVESPDDPAAALVAASRFMKVPVSVDDAASEGVGS